MWSVREEHYSTYSGDIYVISIKSEKQNPVLFAQDNLSKSAEVEFINRSLVIANGIAHSTDKHIHSETTKAISLLGLPKGYDDRE